MQRWLAEMGARLQASGRAPQRPSLEAAPCDFCPRATRCATEQLACTAFERFNAGLHWEIAPRVDANHERYQRIFAEDGRAHLGYLKR